MLIIFFAAHGSLRGRAEQPAGDQLPERADPVGPGRDGAASSRSSVSPPALSPRRDTSLTSTPTCRGRPAPATTPGDRTLLPGDLQRARRDLHPDRRASSTEAEARRHGEVRDRTSLRTRLHLLAELDLADHDHGHDGRPAEDGSSEDASRSPTAPSCATSRGRSDRDRRAAPPGGRLHRDRGRDRGDAPGAGRDRRARCVRRRPPRHLRAEQSQVASDIAQRELEALRRTPYTQLALTSTPAVPSRRRPTRATGSAGPTTRSSRGRLASASGDGRQRRTR